MANGTNGNGNRNNIIQKPKPTVIQAPQPAPIVKFNYNEDVENKFNTHPPKTDSWYGDKTFANQRALQSFGQG